MGLFDKSKHNDDLTQIKQMNASTKTQQPHSNQNLQDNQSQMNSNLNQSNQNSQNDFVNPFSNQAQNTGSNLNSSQNPNFTNQQNSSQNFSLNSNQLPSFDSSSNQQNTQIPNLDMYSSSNFNSNSMPNNFSQPSMNQQSSYGGQDEIQAMINETVEKIIEEKWVELTENVQKVVTWKLKVEEQITLIKEDVTAMQEGFSNLEKRLINKINNYDKSILDVGSEIKALDKVFQKITPTLVNNVTELGRIAKDLKGVSHERSTNSKD